MTQCELWIMFVKFLLLCSWAPCRVHARTLLLPISFAILLGTNEPVSLLLFCFVSRSNLSCMMCFLCKTKIKPRSNNTNNIMKWMKDRDYMRVQKRAQTTLQQIITISAREWFKSPETNYLVNGIEFILSLLLLLLPPLLLLSWYNSHRF